MRTIVTCLILAAGTLVAQPPLESRVLRISSAKTAQDFAEVATVIRSIAEIRDLSVDMDQRTITMWASAQQVSFADWLARELDPATNASPRFQVGPDDVARIFYVKNAPGVQGFQEMATAMRSLVEIRRLFTYNTPRAIVARGTPDQLAAAEWILGELDQPLTQAPPRGARAFEMSGVGNENVVRIFHLTAAATIQDFQEAAVLVRSIGDIRRVFTYNPSHALLIRGTADQAALADWLTTQLEGATKPVESTTAIEYRMSDAGMDNVVRVFRLAHAASTKRLQEVATEVRTAEKIRRVFTCNTPRLVAMRGTQDQMDSAVRLVKERDKN